MFEDVKNYIDNVDLATKYEIERLENTIQSLQFEIEKTKDLLDFKKNNNERIYNEVNKIGDIDFKTLIEYIETEINNNNNFIKAIESENKKLDIELGKLQNKIDKIEYDMEELEEKYGVNEDKIEEYEDSNEVLETNLELLNTIKNNNINYFIETEGLSSLSDVLDFIDNFYKNK